MDKVIKFPPDFASIFGVAVIAVLAVFIASKIPGVKTLV
jgi:hypothetical protein